MREKVHGQQGNLLLQKGEGEGGGEGVGRDQKVLRRDLVPDGSISLVKEEVEVGVCGGLEANGDGLRGSGGPWWADWRAEGQPQQEGRLRLTDA